MVAATPSRASSTKWAASAVVTRRSSRKTRSRSTRQGEGRGVAARASASGFLRAAAVRSGVGAEEEAGAPGGGGAPEGLHVAAVLEDGEASVLVFE